MSVDASGRSGPGVWDAAGLILLAVLLVVILATFRDYGMGWDEPDHRGYGERILGYHEGLWTGVPDTRVFTKGNLYLYGGAFDTVVQLLERVTPFAPYDSRHLITALVGWAGVAACCVLGRLVAGPRAGFLAGLLLVLTPLYYGHLFFNPKDLPYAAGTAASLALLLAFVRRLPRPGIPLTVALGGAIGATMGVRVGGVQLLALLVAGSAAALVAGPARPVPWRRGLAPVAGVAAIAWLVMLLAWPWARLAPLANPWRALRSMSRFDWGLTVLFRGEWLPSLDLPRAYLPEYLLLTLPEVFLAGLVLALGWGVARVVALRARLEVVLVAAAALAPLAFAVAMRPPMYDGARHFLFTIPPLAVLAAWGADRTIARAPGPVRAVLLGGLLVGSAVALRSHRDLHPYAYAGYNALAGGLEGASGRYETDYWGTSYRELVGALEARLRSEGREGRPVRVWTCSDPLLASWYFPASWSVAPTPDRADFLLATTRWDCHRRFPGDVVADVRRLGVTLSVAIAPAGAPAPPP